MTPPGASYGSLLLMRNERLRDGVQLGPTRPCYSRFLAGRGPELLGVGAAAQSIRAPTPIPSPALASCFSSYAPWRTGTFLGVRDRSWSPAPAAGTVCINLPHAQPPLAEPAAGRGKRVEWGYSERFPDAITDCKTLASLSILWRVVISNSSRKPQTYPASRTRPCRSEVRPGNSYPQAGALRNQQEHSNSPAADSRIQRGHAPPLIRSTKASRVGGAKPHRD